MFFLWRTLREPLIQLRPFPELRSVATTTPAITVAMRQASIGRYGLPAAPVMYDVVDSRIIHRLDTLSAQGANGIRAPKLVLEAPLEAARFRSRRIEHLPKRRPPSEITV